MNDDLFRRAAELGSAYRRSLKDRPVRAAAGEDELRSRFSVPLARTGVPAAQVLEELAEAATPGLVSSAGPRFFGFVVGGSLPSAAAADMLAAAWDQNAFNATLAPAAIAAEEAAGGWLKELLGLPATASVGFVTGAQAANTVGLAAGRHHVLAAAGWDVETRGLTGAPPITVVAGEDRHATVDRSLRLLGLGTDSLRAVPSDANGAMDIAQLGRVLDGEPDGPLIVSLQAGNVNTGACDNIRAACELAHARGGWVHVDGAFGLWAAANPATRHLVDGVELADSWGCDGHKWLNVPYDSGFAFCAHPRTHAEAASYVAPYLAGSGIVHRAADFTLESSRRARGFAVWAALRELGRDGVAALVERCCGHARRFADLLRAAGFEIANEVVLNQVLVGFGDDARTERVIAAVQEDGTCWMGPTTWQGRRLMRISVSNATTTDDDIVRSAEAVIRLARAAG